MQRLLSISQPTAGQRQAVCAKRLPFGQSLRLRTPDSNRRWLGHLAERGSERGYCLIDLRAADDQRRLEADDVAVDPSHAHQHPLPQ